MRSWLLGFVCEAWSELAALRYAPPQARPRGRHGKDGTDGDVRWQAALSGGSACHAQTTKTQLELLPMSRITVLKTVSWANNTGPLLTPVTCSHLPRQLELQILELHIW